MKNKIAGLLSAVLLSASAYAGEEEDALIAKVVAAYGGEALTGMTTFQLSDVVLGTSLGQAHTPDLDEITTNHQSLTIDYTSGKALFETYVETRGGNFQNATFSDGEKAYNVNFQQGTFGEAASADMYTFAGGFMRTTDAILAYELNKAAADTTIGGEADHLNRPHTKITMPFPQSPDLTLFIDNETHLISKMQRTTQFGDLDYVFKNYKESGGVTYASTFNFFVGGQPNLMSASRALIFNADLSDEIFAVPSDVEEEGERIDTSEMSATKVADGIYHVGQGNGFSLFVDTDAGVIGTGGYPALTARLEKYQEEAGVYKALTHQIVTHHHNDHLGGLGEATGLGAKLVTVSANVEEIQNTVTPSPEKWQFMTVGKRTAFGSGKNQVDVYEISTVHSAGYLLVHLPGHDVIFTADHYGSPYKTGLPNANMNTVSMLEAIDGLDIEVDTIVTSHGARVFTMKEMRDSVAAYSAQGCAGQRSVCR